MESHLTAIRVYLLKYLKKKSMLVVADIIKRDKGHFADKIFNEFLNAGLSKEQAKKCSIKSIHNVINELQLIDGVYLLGLKKTMDFYRESILLIIEF